MSPTQLLALLREHDIRLWYEDGQLRYSAPPHALTDELRAAIAQHRAELLAIFKQHKNATIGGPILPVSRNGDLPLSFAQERLWFLDQLGDGAAYNMPWAFRVEGRLDLRALEQSLNEIVRRHEVLRTGFPAIDGKPVQQIRTTLHVPVSVIDASQHGELSAEAEAQRLYAAEAIAPFDLAQGPLLRATVVRLAQRKQLLFLSIHHIVFDGWSWHLFWHELTAHYAAFSQGQVPCLPALSIQYADFAVWQRQRLQGATWAKQLDYWRERLDGLQDLQLPIAQSRPPVKTSVGKMHGTQYSRTLLAKLKLLAQQEQVTLFMILLAAFKILLYRYSGQEDIVLGSPIANRNRPELEGIIGFFANTLVLRTDLSGQPTFRALLKRVKETTLGAYDHQDVPFEQLVVELQPERDLSRNPLVQAMFNLHNAPVGQTKLGNLSLEPFTTESQNARFDLGVHFREEPDALQMGLVFNTDLFETETIARMAGHFEILLEGIVANPNQDITLLPLLPKAERHQILVEWNDTRKEYPLDQCLHQLFETQVERTPRATAVIFGEERLTYRELNRRANQLAHYLRRQILDSDDGTGSQPVVGICVERSLEMVVALLGVLKASCAYVPFEPDYPVDLLAGLIGDAQAPLLLTQAKLPVAQAKHGAKVLCLDKIGPHLRFESETNPVTQFDAESLAYLMYTSGTTGKPKGAMVTHRGICNSLLWRQDVFQLTENDRVLHKAPLSFDVSVWELFWPLLTGAVLVVAEPERHYDTSYLVNLIKKRDVSFVHFVPSVLKVFLNEPGLSECTSLKRVWSSGEALPVELKNRFIETLPAELINGYGLAETSTVVSYEPCRATSRDSIVPIGCPIANTQLYVLDAQRQPVPIGATGELYVGGVSLARGYWDRQDLTASRFVPNPFSDRDDGRLYKTGDLARYLPDGRIEFLGRADYQVKIRGVRVELGEIETALRQHPSERETVVTAQEEQSNKRLVAYIVSSSETEMEANELRQYLRTKLPETMPPATFIPLDELPLSPNGKVDRRALPAPDLAPLASDATPVAPRTPIEEVLARIWGEVLGLERIGVHDDFFELGGHSLLATQVVSRIHRLLRIELPVQRLFEAPTVAELSDAVIVLESAPGQAEKMAAIVQRVMSMSNEERHVVLREQRKEREMA